MSNAIKNAHHQLDIYGVPRTAEERETGDTLQLSLTQRIVLLKKGATSKGCKLVEYPPCERNH